MHRPRLADRLSDALQGRLTVVAADAGFGKTTLLADFLQRSGRAAVWVRLDAFDSDPAVFAGRLVEAMRRHVRGGRHGQAGRGLALVRDWTSAAQLLSAVLLEVRRELVVVLDDYHVLNAPTLSAGMTRLIQNLPPRVHLVILSRADPELPLARWRAEGSLAEFGTDDLRFTPAELRALLVGHQKLPLTDASVHVLAAKTEGWAAGIVLALHTALSLGPAHAAQAIAALSGSSREIYDYLAQEAFDRQSADVQRFLLATSVLSRFTPEIAGELLGIGDPRRIVSHLERNHLFLVALDRERRWYRYHHLFAEFLQRIFAGRDADEIRVVHRRAAQLWEARGEVAEAIEHALAAGSHEDAARLVAVSGEDVVATGRFDTVRRWISRIPPPYWDRYPRVFLAKGMCEMVVGDRETAARSFYRAYTRLRESADTAGAVYSLRQFAARVFEHGGWRTSEEAAEPWRGWQALVRSILTDLEPQLPEFPPAAQAVLAHLIGWLREVEGELDVAERLQRQAHTLATEGKDAWAELSALRALARVLGTRGKLAESRRVLETLVARSKQLGWAHEEAHFHAYLSELSLDTGQLDEAESRIREASDLAEFAPCRVLDQQLRFLRACAAQARGLRDAEGLLLEVLKASDVHSPDLYARACIRLSLLLADREPARAEEFALRAVATAARIGPFDHGRALLSLGTVTRSRERCAEAAKLLDGSPHWRGLALVRAAEYAEGPAAGAAKRAALDALRAVPGEAWPFLAVQAGPVLLAYRGDPEMGPRVATAIHARAAGRGTLAVRCLGTFELLRNGVAVPATAWRRATTRRLFQFLLVHSRPVQREEILDGLWPDLGPTQAANQLRVALSHLRRVLEPERSARAPSFLIVVEGPTLALARERIEIDLDRFAAAASRAESSEGQARRSALLEAVELYRGDLLEDSPYEEWSHAHRERLARRYLDLLAMLAQDEERVGDWAFALERWRRVVERDPGAEHAYRGLMRCYAAMGRTADVFRAFDDCRVSLADLGARPSPETVALRDAITASPL